MHYVICIHADDAIQKMRSCMEPETLAALGDGPLVLEAPSEQQAHRVLHQLFPALIANSPLPWMTKAGVPSQSLDVFRDRSMQEIVAAIFAEPDDDDEAAALVTIAASGSMPHFSFSLWLPEDLAQAVMETITQDRTARGILPS